MINPAIPDFYSGGSYKKNNNISEENKSLQKNILFTLAYYASQDYPLTSFETWRHMHDLAKTRKVNNADLAVELDNLAKKGFIKNSKGFWMFSSETDDVSNKRINKQKISCREIKKARRWARAAFFLPYVRGIFCAGTLGMKKASIKSDWDVLVVLEEKKIWIGRFFISAFFQIFGKRRTDRKINSRFCLNHFLAQNGLILEEQNEFTSKEISFSFPLVGKKQFQKFIQLNEFWVSKYLPNFEKDRMLSDSLNFNDDLFSKKVRKSLEKLLKLSHLGDLLNRVCKFFMIQKIKKNRKTYFKGADVRYNDRALVFLPRPQRKQLMSRTMAMLTMLNLAKHKPMNKY